MIVYKKTYEWNILWQRVATIGTNSGEEWQRVVQRMTTIDNDWYNEWQGVTTNDNEWYKEWEHMITSGTTNESEWEQIKESDFRFQNETKGQPGIWRFLFSFYAMYNYNILNNIGYL